MAAQTVEAQVKAVLGEYDEEVRDIVADSVKKSGEWTARLLRRTSPRKTGEYASGWTSRFERQGMIATATAYNRKKPHVTQFLENSHVIKNKSGEYGRTYPGHGQYPHIKEAEAQGQEYFEELVRERLNNG